ncbi:MAG: replication-associated recombination protein A [Gammaproteobacteria bacterium]|nr:replication-associated recombination protein A [Gammaproteobacteria bacterium]MBQ0840602.1 replication-associated recombination protein A [Gammaproteobacteria bacterium]
MTESLFSASSAAEESYQPLAARMRPRELDDFFGQQHLLAPGKPLRDTIAGGKLHSMIFWGPPGVGKTTLARLIAETTDASFQSLSAVLSGVKDIRGAIQQAEAVRAQYGRKTILFVDEVHRFNKSQQDAFLPFVENGTIILVGATTENPSFELNNALLSRCRVYVLQALDNAQIAAVIQRALLDTERGFAGKLAISDEALTLLVSAADGDARKSLNLLEIASDFVSLADDGGTRVIERAQVEQVITTDTRRFDKGGEYFYDQISALHKAVRGSSPDGALYWYARMLDGGCDPLYIARRVVRMASEDIGNADPRALRIALDAWEVQERLGSPEGELAIAQAIAYMAAAAKSNALYKAYNQVVADVRSMPSHDVPLHLRNAPTKLMKEQNYGAEYRYAHDEPEGFAAGENYLPQALQSKQYYHPVERGLELKIAEKLRHLRALNKNSPLQRYAENTPEQQSNKEKPPCSG